MPQFPALITDNFTINLNTGVILLNVSIETESSWAVFVTAISIQNQGHMGLLSILTHVTVHVTMLNA